MNEDSLQKIPRSTAVTVTRQAVNCCHAGAYVRTLAARAPGRGTIVDKPLYTTRNGGSEPGTLLPQHECCQNGPPATTTPSPLDRHGRGWRGERGLITSSLLMCVLVRRHDGKMTHATNTPKVNIFVGARTILCNHCLFSLQCHSNM